MSKKNIEFDPGAILQREKQLVVEPHQLTLRQPCDPVMLSGIDINSGDTEQQLFFGNPRSIKELADDRLIPHFTDFEIARHFEIVGVPDRSQYYMARAVRSNEIDRIKESADALEAGGLPEAVANYFRGAFLMRIGEFALAKEMLELAIQLGEYRAANHYLYNVFRVGGLDDQKRAITLLAEFGMLQQYVVKNVAHRFCREVCDFDMPLKLAGILVDMGYADIAQAVLGDLILHNNLLVYLFENKKRFSLALNRYNNFIAEYARTEEPFKLPQVAAMLEQGQFDSGSTLIDSMPENYSGRLFLECMYELYFPGSKYGGRYVENVFALQNPSNLYTKADSDLLWTTVAPDIQ